MRVLGIDTSLRSTGWGVVDGRGTQYVAADRGVIRVPSSALLSECLRRIHDEITGVIARLKPEAAAIEGVFLRQNVRTAVILGEARGAAIAACTAMSLRIFEYAPRKVKQAVVGVGSADKSQVQAMIRTLLGLRDPMGDDESDALAVAVCHLHHASRPAILLPDEI